MEVVAVIVAAIGLTGAIVKYFTSLQKDLQEIHVLVNDRMTEALKRIDQLTEALRTAGVHVPDHPDRD